MAQAFPTPIMTAASSRESGERGKRGERPFRLTLLSYALLALGIAGWLRFAAALGARAFWLELLGPGMTAFLAGGGLAWGVLGVVLAVAVRRGWRRALPLAWFGVVFFPASYWLTLLFVARSPERWANLPFMLGLTLAWLALAVFALARSKGRAYLNQ